MKRLVLVATREMADAVSVAWARRLPSPLVRTIFDSTARDDAATRVLAFENAPGDAVLVIVACALVPERIRHVDAVVDATAGLVDPTLLALACTRVTTEAAGTAQEVPVP